MLFAPRDEKGGWRSVTYADALEKARRIAQALLKRGLSAERPDRHPVGERDRARATGAGIDAMSASPMCRSRPRIRSCRRTSASWGT